MSRHILNLGNVILACVLLCGLAVGCSEGKSGEPNSSINGLREIEQQVKQSSDNGTSETISVGEGEQNKKILKVSLRLPAKDGKPVVQSGNKIKIVSRKVDREHYISMNKIAQGHFTELRRAAVVDRGMLEVDNQVENHKQLYDRLGQNILNLSSEIVTLETELDLFEMQEDTSVDLKKVNRARLLLPQTIADEKLVMSRAIQGRMVAFEKTDDDGRLEVNLPYGEYYLISSAFLDGIVYEWFVPLTIQASSDEAIELNNENALFAIERKRIW